MNTPMANRPGTVGRPSPLMEPASIRSPASTKADASVRGPNVMLGYLRAENPGVLEPLADGWQTPATSSDRCCGLYRHQGPRQALCQDCRRNGVAVGGRSHGLRPVAEGDLGCVDPRSAQGRAHRAPDHAQGCRTPACSVTPKPPAHPNRPSRGYPRRRKFRCWAPARPTMSARPGLPRSSATPAETARQQEVAQHEVAWRGLLRFPPPGVEGQYFKAVPEPWLFGAPRRWLAFGPRPTYLVTDAQKAVLGCPHRLSLYVRLLLAIPLVAATPFCMYLV